MAPDTLTLTVNQRLARYLRVQYAKTRREAGEPVCEPPLIYSWAGWLREQYTAIQNATLQGQVSPPALLSTAQAERLWEAVLAESSYGESLLQLAATARAARQAWVLGKQWRLDPALLERIDLPDTRAFAAWSRGYEKQCAAHGWIDNTLLADYLAPLFEKQHLIAPPIIRLVGFDDITPQQQALLDTLQKPGRRIEAQTPSALDSLTVQRLACPDAQAEIKAAADWVRQCLQTNTAARIAIVAPDLEACRPQMIRALDESLQAGQRLRSVSATPPYNISLGQKLSDIPLVFASLQALQLAAGSLGYEQAGSLLRTPFLEGAQTETYSRAALELQMRRQRRVRVDLFWLMQFCADKPGCAVLAKKLRAAHDYRSEAFRTQTAEQWAQSFSRWLKTLGWPNGRALDSNEYQSWQAWQGLLAEFGSLGLVAGQWSASQAVTQLRRLASTTVFQPQTPDTQVEVLGMLEAAGQQFDHVWILGLHDNAWPAPPRPDPFLPRQWQREAGVPHSNAAREYEYAQRITRRLLQLAPDTVISWPQREGDALLRPSPLIRDLPEADDSIFNKHKQHTIADILFATRQRESIPKSSLPVLLENSEARGGTWLLADQAACPFRAAAKHRWQALELEQPAIGLNAADRGALLHALMENLWAALVSRQELTKLSEAQRGKTIGQAVAKTVSAWCNRHPGVLEGRFRALEEKRLAALATEWLAIEAERSDFSTDSTELDQTLTIGGLQLHTRLDRIDRLPDGSRMVIDYKTGKVSAADWLGERPDAPQLPFYALANRDQLAGVLFARLTRGESAYLGVTRDAGIVPGVADFESWKLRPEDCDSFDALLDNWQTTLASLAADYRQGKAPVDPKNDNSCKYCHLKVLCRINEQSIGGDEDVEGGTYE